MECAIAAHGNRCVRFGTAQVYEIAAAVRRQIGGVPKKPPAFEAIVGRTGSASVNGRRLRLLWDIGGEVRDDRGRRVLGACVHDPAGPPNTVMIRVNGEHLKGQPEVIRSTGVHELAHAIFDMPGVLGESRRVFRTMAEPTASKGIAVLDWSEWRANEFMGGFLVPWDRLSRAVAAQAAVLGLRFRWRERTGKVMSVIEAEPSCRTAADRSFRPRGPTGAMPTYRRAMTISTTHPLSANSVICSNCARSSTLS